MASTLTAKVVGLDKLAKKLAVEISGKDEQQLVKTAGEQTKTSYGPTLPRATGASASKLSLSVTETSAKVSVPRHPFVFLEKGSQYPHVLNSRGNRSHRAKKAAQWKTGTYRIKARRFQSKERSKVRKRLIALLTKLKADKEKRWAA